MCTRIGPESKSGPTPRKPRRMPNIALDSTVILWVAVARAFSTNALASGMKKYLVKEIAEVGGRGGEPTMVDSTRDRLFYR